MADQALLHFSVDGDTLLGVWVNTTDGPEGFYPAGEDDGDTQYGEAVVLAEPWAVQLDRLPQVSPYVANWVVTDCGLTESAADIYSRVNAKSRD